MTWILMLFFACGTGEDKAAESTKAADDKAAQDKKARLEAAERKQVERQKKKREREQKLIEARKVKAQESRKTLGIADDAQLGAVFVTSMGDIKCDLLLDVAPVTVTNFVQLAEGSKEWTHPESKKTSKTPLYSGTKFHRVIPNFMIQGGDPLGSGRGGPGYKFEDEPHPEHRFDQPGLLAMANSGPNTNGSQFFITDRSKPSHLNGKHTIFGKCENLDVVESIASTPTKPTRSRSEPITDVVLKKVRITR